MSDEAGHLVLQEKETVEQTDHDSSADTASSILMISNTGGGGHETACNNIIARLAKDDPQLNIHKVDFVSDALNFRFMKRLVVNLYDKTSLSGNTFVQDWVIRLHPIAEISWLLLVYRKMLHLLQQRQPHRIVCTQPMGLIPLLAAIDHYNRSNKRNVLFELWLTDLPTYNCQHYFSGIRAVSSQMRKLIRIYTPPPLCEGGRSEEIFWRFQCRVGIEQVKYLTLETQFNNPDNRPPLPISSVVLEQTPLTGKEVSLQILFNNDDERGLVQSVAGDLFRVDPSRGESGIALSTVQVHIGPNDRVISLMLGSNPSTVDMLEYMELFMQNEEFRNRMSLMMFPASPSDARIFFFIFCGKHTESKRETPLSTIVNRIKESMQLRHIHPLRFIPMGFQTPKQIAPLTARSDVVIRQAGGLSSMELLSVALKARELYREQLFYIHVPLGVKCSNRRKVTPDRLRSKAIKHYEKKHGVHMLLQMQRERCQDWTLEAFQEYLIDKCYRPWEAGNAQYLRKVIDAIIINPKLNTSPLFRLSNQQES